MDKFQIIMKTSSMDELEIGEHFKKFGILPEQFDLSDNSTKDSI